MKENERIEVREISSLAGYEASMESLLEDSVNNGASVGFIAPLNAVENIEYWQSVTDGLIAGTQKCFVAICGDEVLGSVQLSLCHKANGSHRGEIEKLLVKTSARGQGIAKRLMAHLEAAAIKQSLSLLVLDTRLGDVASHLYRSLDYQEAGQIPNFARSSDGELAATVYFYKQL